MCCSCSRRADAPCPGCSSARTPRSAPTRRPARSPRPPRRSSTSPAIGSPTRPSSPRRRARCCAPTPSCGTTSLRTHARRGRHARRRARAVATTASRIRSGRRNPYFDFWKQAYLVTAKWAEDMLQNTEGLDETHAPARRVLPAPGFERAVAVELPAHQPGGAARDVRDATPRTSCRAWRSSPRTWRSRATCSRSARRTRPPSRSAATWRPTPGKVVFQNDIFQLIQYAPTTDKVREVPLLIVPPWINKYYILDLTPAKSLHQIRRRPGLHRLRHLVGQPGRAPRRTSPSRTTCIEGILTAADAVKRETGIEKINVVGYCVGGTLLGYDARLSRSARRGAVPLRDVPHDAGRFHQGRRPPAVHRRQPARVARTS